MSLPSYGRMGKVQLLDQHGEAGATGDIAWSTVLKFRQVAPPRLNLAQQQVVRNEYFDGASARVEGCRAALLNYMVQELMAATNVTRQLPPTTCWRSRIRRSTGNGCS